MSTTDPSVPLLPPIPPNIASLTTPLLFGEIFNAYFFGVLSVQVYFYHLTFSRDALYLKVLVYGIFALDLLSTAMATSDTIRWFGFGFGNLLALDDVYLSPFDTPMMGALVAAIVQWFYCYRIWLINRRAWPVSVTIGLIAVAHVVAGIYSAVLAHAAGSFSEAATKGLASGYVVFIGAAVVDILIVLSMVAILATGRNNVNQKPGSAVRKILILIVETNLLSSLVAILTVILLVRFNTTNYFTAFLFLGKIYSNSLVLLLNNRQFLTGGISTVTGSQNSAGMLGAGVAVKMSTFRTTEPSHSVNTMPVSLDGTMIGSTTEWDGKLIPDRTL